MTNLVDIHRLLTETEAANMLRVKVATLRRWRWSGDGPHFTKIGYAVRYELADLQRFITDGKRSSTSAVTPPQAGT